MAHLIKSQRDQLDALRKTDLTQGDIAQIIGCSQSTVSRELRRNGSLVQGCYSANAAQRHAENRKKQSYDSQLRWHDDELLCLYVEAEIRDGKTPDQIAAHLKDTYPHDVKKHISHEAIYQAIYVLPRGTLRKELTDCLRRSHRHRRKRRYLRQDRRGQIPDMVSIHDRPQEVESREILGHWEGDLIVGKYNTSAIGTLVERTSRKILICKLEGRSSDDVVQAFDKRLKALPPTLRASLTYD